MKKLIVTAALLLAATFVIASPYVPYRVEPTNGTVAFSITKWGVLKEQGTFRTFTGSIVYAPNDPARASVWFDVDASSIDTKNSGRDQTLRSVDFFDVANYPKLSFRSTRVTPRNAREAVVTGNLTIRGVTKQITFPVKLVGSGTRPGVGDLVAFETTFTINRNHFGVTGGRWIAGAPGALSNDVTIHVLAGGVRK
jgi:polyisoprenoid-binding protein YceI